MSFAEWSNKKKKEREEEEKKASQSSSSSSNNKENKPSFSEWSNKKYGITDIDSAQGQKGWQKYLDDQSSAKQQEAEDESFWDKLGRWLGPTGATDTTLPMGNTAQIVHDVRNDTSYTKPSDDWSDEQRYEFGALYLESPEKAYAYAEKTNNANNKAKEEAEIKKIQDSATSNGWAGLGHTAGAIASAGLGLADYLNMLVLSNAGRDPLQSDGIISPFEYSQAVTEGIGTHLNETYGTLDEDIPIIGGKGWGDVYGLGTSIAQSAVSGYTLGPAGTLVSYFGQGAASGMKDALERGAEDWQAAWYGAALGAFEGVAETIGIDNLFKLGSSSTIKGLLKNILQQAKAEGLEEGFTSVLSNIADAWIMQDKSNFNAMLNAYMEAGMSEKDAKWAVFWDSLEGIAFDMIAGAASGGIHGGLQTGIQTGKYSSYVKNAFGGQTQDIVNDALNSPHSSVQEIGQKYQEKLDSGKSLSGWNLYELLETTDSNKIKDATLKRLGELGETSDVTAVAEVLVKQAMGQELSSKDQNILNNSKYGNLVSTELMHENILSDGLFDKWSENIGTRMVSPEVYNKGKNVVAEDFPNKIVTKGVPEEGITTEAELEASEEGDATLDDTISIMNNMVEKMELSDDVAGQMLEHFKPSDVQQAKLYQHAVPLAYNYGKIGYSAGLRYITSLSEQDKNYAYRRGAIDALIEADSKQSQIESAKTGSAQGTTKKKGIIYEGGYEYKEKTATPLQKSSMKTIEAINAISNLEIHVFESVEENGKRVYNLNGEKVNAPNGYFKDGNKIYIDINAGQYGEGLMLDTLGHEVTHYIRENDAKGFKAIADFLIEQYGKNGVNVEALLEGQRKKIRDRYARENVALPSDAKLNDMAYEELVADAMSEMFNDPKAIEKLAKLKQKDHNAWETLRDAIKNILDKIKSILDQYKTAKRTASKDAVAEEANKVRDFSADAYEKLQDLYIKAFVEADANYEASEGSTKTTSEDVKHSDRDSDYLDAVNRGDMETAQRMVDEAANKALSKSKIRLADGSLRTVYHGTNTGDFTEFNPDFIGMSSGDDGFFGMGFYFAYSKGEAKYYGAKRIISAYLDLKNPFNFEEELQKYKGEKASGGNAPDAVALMNFADKFKDIAKNITISVVEKDSDTVKDITIAEFSKAFKEVIKNKKFEYSEITNKYGEKETLVTADPETYEYEYDGQKRSYVDYSFQKRFWGKPNSLDVAYEYLSNSVYRYVDMIRRTRLILDYNREFTAALKEMGYDGAIQSELGDEAVAFYPSQIKSADPVTYDDNGNVIPLSERFKADNSDIRYSDRDSLGNELSAEQQEFFKDSKVRDKKGNLLVVYHGTTSNFNTFKKGDVGFHFGTKGAARGRVGFGKNVTLKGVYLNLTNPIEFDEDLGSWDADYRLTQELYEKGILTMNEARTVLISDDGTYRRPTESANKKLASVLVTKGYDGISYQNTLETKKATTSYIAFNSNQVKEITNKTPTSNPDIRYSERNIPLTDSDLDAYMRTGKTLHTRNKKTRMLEAGKKPILTSSLETSNFISDAIHGKAPGEVRAFGKVGGRLATSIMEVRHNLNLYGKYLELNADDLRESHKRHSSPKEKGDIALTDQDFERIPEYMDEFDGILSVNTYNGKTEIHLYKKVNDDYIRVLTVSSNERDSLQVTKLIGVSKEKFEGKYAKKIERDTGSSRSQNDSNPSTKARHTAGALSDDIIPQNTDSVKREFSEDIRYSDREIQPITEEEYQTLEKHFGVTGNFRVAGYLLPNGKLLDFSGKHWGDTTSRSRQVDHRDVNEVLDRGNNGYSSMVDMIGSGSIRLMPETGGINLAVYPNEKQRRVLSIYIKQMLATEGQVIVDYDAVGGDTVYSRVYEKYASSEQILRDIRNYFNGARQSDLMQFHTMYSDRRADVSEIQDELERLNIETKDVISLADGYFKNYGGAMNRSEIRYAFLRAIKIMSETTADSYEQAFEEIVRIADELSYNPKVPDNIMSDLKEMKNHIRGIRFRVHDVDKPEFYKYGGFGEFRKMHMGKLTLTNDGISVDSVYKELQGLYGTSWFPDVNTVSEQLMQIANVVDTDPASAMELDYDPKETSRYTVDDIVQRMGDIISASWNKKREDKTYKGHYINYRDIETISNRTLLANALDSVAKNDIEKNRLNQYKSKIALIESEQAKLSKIRAELRELYFTKGRRDTDKIKSLQFEATQIENRINAYDRQLLKLESTEALKGVLDREKKMAYKQAEQRGKESLRRQKEKDAATVRELMARNYESRKKATESRNKTAMREKIKKVVKDLNKLLLNPTQDKHVPIGLQKVVAEALDVINMDTMNAEERVAYYNDLISKSNNPDEIAMLKKKRDFFEYRDMNFKDRITSLKSAYAEFKESDDPLIRNAHNDAIEDLIKNTADEVGNKSLKDMSLTQLEKVYDMYKAILATVRNTNKMFKEGKKETVTENSDAVKREVRSAGGHKDRVLKMTKFLKKFGWDMLKPVTAMKVIGSQTFERLFNNVRAAEDTWAVDVNEAKQFFEDVAARYGFNKWDFKKFYTFKDGAGENISMSLEQIMSLYAYSKRSQADEHLEFGGFIFDDSIEVTENKLLGIPLKYEVNDANPHRLRKEHLLDITSALTPEQRGFVDEMQNYLSDVMGAKGNEVSLAMYDIKLYKEKNYFPLKTSRYFREFDPEKSATPKIKNSGFSKKTVPKAGNPIVLSNFMDVWAGHVNDMSMYHAFVLPLEDFMRVYNYSLTAGGYDSVQQYIKNAYGSQANQYIERLMDDLNGGARVDSSAGIMNKLISLHKKASVVASASVVVQQPSAIARALAYIHPKYFAKATPSALNVAKHKTLWEEVKKYAPVAVIKEMGYFDTGVGRSTVEWIKGDQTFMDKMDDVLSKAPAIADELCWVHIWEAVKRETQATSNLKVGSEIFLMECGKRFTEVITNTQVYDSVLSRSGYMRSKDTGIKMATAFMAEPTTTVNMMVDGIIQGKRGNKSFTAKTVGAISTSIILNSILVALVYAARDDDEDETYIEKYIGSLTSELLDGFNPLTYLPYIKDGWSLLQGYDVERSDMAVLSDLADTINGLFNENTSGWDKVLDVTGSVSSLFGIPLKNIIRDAKGMYNLTQAILSGTPTTGAGIGEAIEDGFKSSIPLWDILHESDSKADRLYKAIMSGDQDHIDRVKATYKSEQAYETALKSALRENDSRIHEAAQARLDGNISEYTRIAREIIAEGHFSQDTVVAAINSEMSAIKKGESTQTESTDSKDEVTSIYRADDINVAFDNGDTSLALSIIDELVEMKMANGMDEKKAKSSLRSSMTSYWKPLYKQAYASGNTAEMQRIKQILYKSGLYGSATEVIKDVNSWLKN